MILAILGRQNFNNFVSDGIYLRPHILMVPKYRKTDDGAFDGSARRSAQLLKLLMKRGPDRGYFPEPAKSLFILDTSGQEAAAKREFAKEGLVLHFVSSSRCLWAYLGAQVELEAWVNPKWRHGPTV